MTSLFGSFPLFLAISITNLLTIALFENAFAIKYDYNMIYRNFSNKQFVKLGFISHSKTTKPSRSRYNHPGPESVANYSTNQNNIRAICYHNKSTYSLPSIFKLKHFVIPDEIGCYLTVCAANHGDLSALNLLQCIAGSESSSAAFKNSLFRKAFNKLINSLNSNSNNQLLLPNVKNENHNILALSSRHKEMINKISNIIGDNNTDDNLEDINDVVFPLKINKIDACLGDSDETSATDSQSVIHYFWVPYLKFISFINEEYPTYIYDTVKSHVLAGSIELSSSKFEMLFGNSADRDSYDDSIGLLCIEQTIHPLTTFDYWYKTISNIFGRDSFKKFKLRIVANYSIPKSVPLAKFLQIVAIDRLWHNIKTKTKQSKHSVEDLLHFYKDNFESFIKSSDDLITKVDNNNNNSGIGSLWWTNPDHCIKHLLQLPPNGENIIDKLSLLDLFLQKIKSIPPELFADISEYFNRVINNTKFYSYNQMENNGEFEPAIDYLQNGINPLENVLTESDFPDSAYEILKNNYKNQLFVRRNDGKMLRSVVNSMYRCGITNRKIPKDGLRILTLDGGGVRAIAPLLILKRLLEEMGGSPLYEMFDLFGATSSGSLILSLLLFHKFTVDETLTIFQSMFTKIFSRQKWAMMPDVLRYLTSQAKFDHNTLEKYSKTIFGDLKMHEFNADHRTPHVFFTSTQTSPWPPKSVIFRSYPLRNVEDLDSDCNLEELNNFNIWEVLRSSTAAPTYFEQFTKEDKCYSDGAILANNPTLEAINEAKLLYPGTPIKCAVSIGTGIFRDFEDGKPSEAFKAKSGNGGLVELLTYASTNVEHVHRYSRMILGSDRYFRLNPLIPEIPLDETNLTAIEELIKSIEIYLSDEQTKNIISKITRLLL